MKVLVTGAAGFIGSHVVRELIDRGHTVFSVDRIRAAVSEKGERLQCTRIDSDADLSDFDKVHQLFRRVRPDCVVHLAGQYSVKYTTENMHRYVSGNLAAFTYILEAAKLTKIPRVIYASSIAISDDGRPSGLYGATKAYNEHAAHAYSRRGVESIGLRYAAVYGPMQRADTPLYRGAKLILQGEPVADFADLKDCKAWVHVRDAARSTVDCVERQSTDMHSVCVLSSPEPACDVGVLLSGFADHVGRPVRFPGSYRPKIAKTPPDLDPLKRIAGRLPNIRLAEGLVDFSEWIAQ